MKTIRIGTRGSRLALIQTEKVRARLFDICPEVPTEICIVKTSGDVLSNVPLDAIGGKGVFVKDIENRLLSNEIDMAVHSLKDMQAILHEGLVISACLERQDPRDMLFSKGDHTIESLPEGSRVGTSSMRRRCLVRDIRPDLAVVDIRGNVQTRLSKIGNEVDAVILAAAGVVRLDLTPGIAMDTGMMTPSPGQGIIAVESRSFDSELNSILRALDHEETRICAQAERSFLSELGQDCNLPAGAYARLASGSIHIQGMLGSTDERHIQKMSMDAADTDIGARLAHALMDRIHGRA